MKKVEHVLLAQRTTDGKFFGMNETRHTTEPYYTDDPVKAHAITSCFPHQCREPMAATYYFENSTRMKSWLEDCVMKYYIITTTITAKAQL